jgi:dGTPase
MTEPATPAPYAVTIAQSRGREHPELPPAFRSQFQRDRDRIVHSSAFRRLEYKTQVFVNHEGDMFRTRLTHSLEVAQIARSVARALNLNEDLTETIALAHDLGHTPFGHAGQDALNARMKAFGGFEHNFQSLRVVEHLEERYPDFPGLNLLFESREGILKHCSVERARTLGLLGLRFIQRTQPTLEAQVANVADEIAYNHHDIDDGVRANLLTVEQLSGFPLFSELHAAALLRWKKSSTKRILYSVIREMLNYFVVDLIEATEHRLAELAPRDLDEVRALAAPIVDFTPAVRTQHIELKRLLRHGLYEHKQVRTNAADARVVVGRLFDALFDDPDILPPEHRPAGDDTDPVLRAQHVADYIAGMTDRFAIGEHRRLFGHNQFATSQPAPP